jgi:predicted AAA+ superfamily ATPase
MLSDDRVHRRLAGAVHAALRAGPVVAITGARTAGKSTLARGVVQRTGGVLVDLDDPAVRRLALADPTEFVRDRPEPVVIDEFQRVSELLSAIKAELNRDRRPGRFVLTGSARPDAVPELADYLTGRVELLRLWPFAMSELEPGQPSIIDDLFAGTPPRRRPRPLSRAQLVELVLRGGYPIAVGLPPDDRDRWFANLAELVVERVSDDLRPVRNSRALSGFLRLAAAGTAQTRNAAELGREIGIGRDQSGVYLRLLELVHLTFELPAWSVNPASRVGKRPKLHLVDSGLAAHLQGLTADRLAATDPNGATRFGALLETFVVTEVMKQLGWSAIRASTHHFRTADGVEVDLVLEAPDGRVVAIEVKAGGRLTTDATRGLLYLRDRLGDRFVQGLVLNTGDDAQPIGDRLAVAPVQALWC